MKVRYIDGSHDPKKEYEVLQEYPRYYRTELGCHKKSRFKIVNDNIKEYTIQEVLQVIEEGQKYKCTRESYNIKFIEKAKTGVKFIYANKDRETLIIGDNARFTLVKQDKEVSVDEALKQYRSYETIYCIWSGCKYTYKFNEDGLINIENRLPISATEILEGKWFVKCQ